jgi:hypothetical protein
MKQPNLEPYIEKFLTEMGFSRTDDDPSLWCRAYEYIQVTDSLIELIDKIYAKGHQDGWSRGAYEVEQQEDLDKADLEKIQRDKIERMNEQ